MLTLQGKRHFYQSLTKKMVQPVFETGDVTARIVTGLEQIGEHIQGLIRAQAQEHGLSPLQIRILIFLHFYEQQATLSTLAASFMLTKATLSVTLRSMEQKELISRKTLPGDRRSSVIELSEWGRRIAHVAGFYPEPLKKIVAPMDHAEKKLLLDIIEGMVSKLEQQISQ